MTLRRLLTSSALPVAVTAVGIVALLHFTGVQLTDLAVYAAYLLVTVAFPGVYLWRLLLRCWHTSDSSPTWFEDLTLGTIFGFGLQLPVYLIGVAIGVPLLFLVLPALTVVASLIPSGRRAWTQPTSRIDWRAAWALAVVTLYGVAWLARQVYPLRPLTQTGNHAASVDETFHQALIAELMHRVPPQFPYLLGVRLDYHWFVHAQLAATRWATHLDSVLLLRQLLPTALLVLTVLGLAAVVLRLTSRSVAAVIAPALLVAGGFYLMGPHYEAWNFTESFMSKRFVSSPSQSYGDMMALPAILLTLEVLRRGQRVPRLVWLTLTLALFALSGSKATFMPIFLCGALAAWAVQLVVKRRIDWELAALVGLFVVVSAFAQFVLFGGHTGGMSVALFHTSEAAVARQGIAPTASSTAAMTATLLVGWWLYGAGGLGLIRERRWLDPRVVWMAVSVLAGTSVAFVFFKSGLIQMWFQRSTAELVVILSAWGIACLLPNPLRLRTGLIYASIAAVTAVLAFVVSQSLTPAPAGSHFASYTELVATALTPLIAGGGYLVARAACLAIKRPQPPLAALVAFLVGLGLMQVVAFAYESATKPIHDKAPSRPLFAVGGVEAADWLAKHSRSDAVVATNVHCLRPHAPECDNRNFWVSAYTQRRIVVEGWGYTAPTNDASILGKPNAHLPVPFPERLAINDAAFERPSRQAVTRLVDTYGVKWLFVSKEYPADLPGLKSLHRVLKKAYANAHYVVFKVRT